MIKNSINTICHANELSVYWKDDYAWVFLFIKCYRCLTVKKLNFYSTWNRQLQHTMVYQLFSYYINYLVEFKEYH